MVNEIRVVRYCGTQDAEDLFRCEDLQRIFIRQQCDKDHVRWLTSSKWTGGYEADCPMKEGLIIRVVDRSGDILFEETLIKEEGYFGTVARKSGPFSWEAIEAVVDEVVEKYHLSSYEDWKSWLLKEGEAHGYTGYNENWLYCESTDGFPEKLQKYSILGEPAHLMRKQSTHNICGKKWTTYDLRDFYKLQPASCYAICGYTLEE